MQAVPNPEDIIWDDIGKEAKEKADEQASDDVMPDNERQDSSEQSTEKSHVQKSLGESDPSDVKM